MYFNSILKWNSWRVLEILSSYYEITELSLHLYKLFTLGIYQAYSTDIIMIVVGSMVFQVLFEAGSLHQQIKQSLLLLFMF